MRAGSAQGRVQRHVGACCITKTRLKSRHWQGAMSKSLHCNAQDREQSVEGQRTQTSLLGRSFLCKTRQESRHRQAAKPRPQPSVGWSRVHSEGVQGGNPADDRAAGCPFYSVGESANREGGIPNNETAKHLQEYSVTGPRGRDTLAKPAAPRRRGAKSTRRGLVTNRSNAQV